ncbi:MAG TPA: hypothetical protein DCS43_01930 [Verrucomicrobia bacterium]|nr:hypothetical protein [Verrucomicrobiota bacterium]
MVRKNVFLAAVAVLFTVAVQHVGAQVNPADGRIPPEGQLRVRRFIGIGPRAREQAPFYQTNRGAAAKRAQDWHVVSVFYDTAPEWIEELLVQFHVLSELQDPVTKQKRYSLYKKSVRYVDIEKGNDHRAIVFLRPAAIKRFGEVVASAAVITLDGKVVNEQNETKIPMPPSWWSNPAVLDSPTLTVREGYLLNQIESPWALLNPDDYEVIK